MSDVIPYLQADTPLMAPRWWKRRRLPSFVSGIFIGVFFTTIFHMMLTLQFQYDNSTKNSRKALPKEVPINFKQKNINIQSRNFKDSQNSDKDSDSEKSDSSSDNHLKSKEDNVILEENANNIENSKNDIDNKKLLIKNSKLLNNRGNPSNQIIDRQQRKEPLPSVQDKMSALDRELYDIRKTLERRLDLTKKIGESKPLGAESEAELDNSGKTLRVVDVDKMRGKTLEEGREMLERRLDLARLGKERNENGENVEEFGEYSEEDEEEEENDEMVKESEELDRLADNEPEAGKNEETGRLIVPDKVVGLSTKKMYDQSALVDGIYWSDKVEQKIPLGISGSTQDKWISQARRANVTSLKPAEWNRCGAGSRKNGIASLSNLGDICVRCKYPSQMFIMGEVLSYWLSRLLKLDNVPPSVLSCINTTQWSHVAKQKTEHQWNPNATVSLTMWINDIDQSSTKGTRKAPGPILQAYYTGVPITSKTLAVNSSGLSTDDITKIAQWSSMIIFDYITGNYDRVASMQDSAEKKPEVMKENIRNLRVSKNIYKLWLIDNESGFLDAYSLLYRGGTNSQRFRSFHRQMLRTVCVFQRSVVKALMFLHKQKSPVTYFQKFAREKEPLLFSVKAEVPSHVIGDFEENFDKRLNEVIEWIEECQRNT